MARRPRSKALVRAAKKRKAREDERARGEEGGTAAAAAGTTGADANTEAGLAHPNRASALETATLFERYYRALGILPAEEWPALLDAFSKPLPVTFRVVGGPRAAEARAAVAAIRPTLEREGAAPLPWCEGWQVSADSGALKMSDRPGLRQLHRWLVEATHGGLVIRQEAVSMVPAALLGIRPGHKLLDMCASPGSKTTQALEAIHGGNAEGGLVVANDTDARRARLLIRRCAALGELTARLAVTQHDATKFPNVLAPCWRDDGPGGTAAGANRYPDGPYDRVLCDVPCSGDGTLRKNPEVWSRWNPEFGASLHMLQLRLALRSIALLRVGGCLAYSTCSLNPAEDEAVVAELLRRCGGSVEVVDVRAGEALEGNGDGVVHDAAAKSRPGVCDWPVYASAQGEMDGDESTLRVPEPGSRGFPRSLWPPTKGETALRKQLRKCLRFWPMDNDTGGFFVCILRKSRALPGPLPRKGGDASVQRRDASKSPRPAPVPCLRRITGAALDAAWTLVSGAEEDADGKARFQRGAFTRSPSSCAGGSVWWLSDATAEHVSDQPGSAKLHVLFAGCPLLARARARGGLGGSPAGRVVARALGFGKRKGAPKSAAPTAAAGTSPAPRLRHEGAVLLPRLGIKAATRTLQVRGEVLCKLLAPVADSASAKASVTLARVVLSTSELRARLSWRELSAFEACADGPVIVTSAKGERIVALAAEKVRLRTGDGTDEAFLVVTWPRTKGLERAPSAAAGRMIRLLGGEGRNDGRRKSGHR